MRSRTAEGYASILVLGLSLIAFSVAGLAVDGTRAFLFRRSLQNSADAAALAGASEIDRRTYYASGGRSVSLDPDAAHEQAGEWLGRRGLPVEAGVFAAEDGVRVVLHGEVGTTFLRLIGVDSISVRTESTARPIAGST